MSNETLTQAERELELEERKAALEARRLENKKLLREADKTRMDDAAKTERDKRKGDALREQRPENRFKTVRKTCNHLMGGNSRQQLLSGQGDDSDRHCVVKVKLPTGDVMVRCQRCRTVWVPPLESDYITNGKLDKEKYQEEIDEYNKAYNFRTPLAMIVLPQYRWALRGGKPINREVTHRFVAGIIGK